MAGIKDEGSGSIMSLHGVDRYDEAVSVIRMMVDHWHAGRLLAVDETAKATIDRGHVFLAGEDKAKKELERKRADRNVTKEG
jgi:hypothetical protein